MVDDDDYEELSSYRWCLQLKPGGYASRTDRSGGRQRTVLMHRQIMGLAPGDPREVDHRDTDRLNCRRENLRIVSSAQNAQNRRVRSDARSRYRGVCWYPNYGKWVARVHHEGRRHLAGYFADEDDAGRAAAELRAKLMTHSEC